MAQKKSSPSERGVESHVLKQGGPEPYTQAGFLTLAVFLEKQRGGKYVTCSSQAALFPYSNHSAHRIFFRIADFDPEDVVQQPVNGLLLVEHEDELDDEVESCTQPSDALNWSLPTLDQALCRIATPTTTTTTTTTKKLPEKFVRASLLLFVSAMARLNCSRMLLSSDDRCSVLCSATRRRSFKAWNSRWTMRCGGRAKWLCSSLLVNANHNNKHIGGNRDEWDGCSDVPLPFCHAVYQDRLRKDVKKMIAVATVPFLSLISFQRCLSSARVSGTPELPLPPSLRQSDVDTGVGAGIWRRQMVKKRNAPVNRTTGTELCAGEWRGAGCSDVTLGVDNPSHCHEQCIWPSWRSPGAGRRAAGGLHLLQPVGKQPGGQLRHIVALGLDQLPRTLRAVPEDVGGRVSLLLPQPRAVHQQRRGHLLRQVRVLHYIVGGHDPGHRAPQGVGSTQTQHTGKHCQGKAAGPHSMELGEWPPSPTHSLVYKLTYAAISQSMVLSLQAIDFLFASSIQDGCPLSDMD
ncbi:hypothetical protein INR49_010204 [Caranx melampygus]|nr:hypothetical protein INR49_010204 [Caranx melampygus]